MNGPIDIVYPEGAAVRKSDVRSDNKNSVRRTMGSVSDVSNTDLSGQFGGIYVRTLKAFFDLDTSDDQEEDGEKVLYDKAGNHFVKLNLGSGGGDASDITNDSSVSGATVKDALDTLNAKGREKLSANRTFYVRADGSDSNNGLANTSGGAFLTIQKAVDAVAALDIAGFSATIQIGDGTYSAGAVLKNVAGFASPGNLVIQGNNTTPANVLISTTTANTHGFIADSLSSVWDIKDLKLQTSTATSNALVAQGGAALRCGNIDFGSCNGIHIQAFGPGSTVTCLSNYAVSGSAAAHYQAYYGAQIIAPGRTITIAGTLSIGFWADMRVLGSGQLFSQTFSGTYTVTGTRYRSSENAVVFVNGAGATYFPGNVNGTPATGGLYV